MLLDIIVPHYNEPWEVVKPFIEMIHNQRGIDFDDFRVTIVHDGVDPFPKEYLKGPAHIHQIGKPQGGVSSARNLGLDMATAKWVNFSDCDDCYSSIFALYQIFHVLKTTDNFDLLWSPFWMIRGNELRLFKDYNSIFIHNKYYRRSFLEEKDIRFCEELHMSEDSAFNAIVVSRIDKNRVGKINTSDPVYSWCRRPGSVTMDPEKRLYNIEGHFERNLYVLEECRRKSEVEKNLMVARTMTDAYAMLTLPGLPGDVDAVLKRIAEFWKKNKDGYSMIGWHEIEKILAMSDLEAGGNEETRKMRPALPDWLKMLETA